MPASVLIRLLRAFVGLGIPALIAAVLIASQPSEYYLWIKAVHVVSIIAWMAGMLLLPRLLVYHCAAAPGSELSQALKRMEHRFLTVIINPAMVVSWGVGVWLGWDQGWFASGWLRLKVVLVLILSAYHGSLASWVRHFAADQNRHSERFYRITNQIPIVLLIAIVALVVVKPF